MAHTPHQQDPFLAMTSMCSLSFADGDAHTPSSSSSFKLLGSSTSVPNNNSFIYSLFNNTIKIVSWNGRAVIAASPRWRRPKMSILWKLIHTNDIILLQEVHGSETSLLLLLSRLANTHFLVYSFCASSNDHSDTGGVVILVRKSAFPDFSFFDSRSEIPGRAMFLALRHPSGFVFKVWNIHNYGFTVAQYRTLTNHIHTDASKAKSDPLSYFTVVGGDFNQHRDDSIRFNLASPASPPISPRTPPIHESSNLLKT